MTIIATLYQKKPCPGGHEILICVYPPWLIIIIYKYSVCLIYAWK